MPVVSTIVGLIGIAMVVGVGLLLFAASNGRGPSKLTGVLLSLVVAIGGVIVIASHWGNLAAWIVGGSLLAFGGYKAWAAISTSSDHDID